MPKTQTEEELRAAMRAIATVAGVRVPDGRDEATLAAYRSYLEAVRSVRGVELAAEAEPACAVSLDRDVPPTPDAGGRGRR